MCEAAIDWAAGGQLVAEAQQRLSGRKQCHLQMEHLWASASLLPKH